MCCLAVFLAFHARTLARMPRERPRPLLLPTGVPACRESEPVGVVPAPVLEKDFLHSINDGFVSGSDTRNAIVGARAVKCAPLPSTHDVKVMIHKLPVRCVYNGNSAAAK